MKILEIKKYLKEKGLFCDCKIKRLGQGNNYQVFLIDDGKEKFTLRMGRDDIVVANNLRDEYINLKFLESEGIEFVQQVKFFDAKNKILILTYVDGKEIGVNDMTKGQVKKFVEQLNILHKIKFSNYEKFCKKNKFKVIKPETQMQHIKRSGLKRFDYIDKYCNKREWLMWLRPRLEKNLKFVKSIKRTESDIIFNHGDLAGANIFLDKGKLFFIDWDKAKFLHNEDYGIGYMFIHGEIEDEKLQNEIIKLYAGENKLKVDYLREQIGKWLQVTKINDIIWAVMMYVEMLEKGFDKPERYLKIAEKRKKEFNEMINF